MTREKIIDVDKLCHCDCHVHQKLPGQYQMTEEKYLLIQKLIIIIDVSDYSPVLKCKRFWDGRFFL